MNMNDERRNTIALLLSRFTGDEEAEREQARAEYESMTDEELSCALENFKHEAEQVLTLTGWIFWRDAASKNNQTQQGRHI